jgi:hypothetical protein
MVASALGAIATFYFAAIIGGALVFRHETWLPSAVAGLLALWVARYIWKHTNSVEPGFTRAVLLGALVTGTVGFCAGFLGPIIFTPSANQGPLLGIFITGPLGFILGGVGGAIYWWVRRRPDAGGSL